MKIPLYIINKKHYLKEKLLREGSLTAFQYLLGELEGYMSEQDKYNYKISKEQQKFNNNLNKTQQEIKEEEKREYFEKK